MKENGAFRHKDGFTAVGNKVVRDKKLSIKAKGIYSVIQSYVTCPDLIITKDFLMSQSTDKDKSFESAWKELKDSGYLKSHITPGKDGKMYTEYDLLDMPEQGAHTFYYSRDGKLTNTDLTRNKNTPKSGVERPSQKGEVANGEDAKGEVAEGANAKGGNNVILANKTNFNTSFYNQSINQDGKNDLTDDAKTQWETIKQNIEYDRLVGVYGDVMDVVARLIQDILCRKIDVLRMKPKDVTDDVLCDRMFMLKPSHIEDMLDYILDPANKIKKLKPCIVTSLCSNPVNDIANFKKRKSKQSPAQERNKHGAPNREQLERMRKLIEKMDENDEGS